MAKIILSVNEAQQALSRYFDNSANGFPYADAGYTVEIKLPEAPAPVAPLHPPLTENDKRFALADFVCEIRNAAEGRQPNLIAAIKAARTLTGMGLKDAKDFTEGMIRDAQI